MGWEEKEKRLEAFTKDETFDTDQDKSILLEVRPDACKVMYGSIVWFVCCVVAFVLWCIRAGRIKLLAGSGFSFLSLIALVASSSRRCTLKRQLMAPRRGPEAGQCILCQP